jgi:hypothetical protein
MDCKMKMLKDTGPWEMVPCPPGCNIVSSKWVFQIKCKSNGSVDKYKAHLVAQGFTQIYSTDYFETYSPVAKLASLWTILTLAVQEDWDINCFDFDGAYLNGKLGEDEDIYMKNPPGYNEDNETVKHIKKSFYRLKQAGQKWYNTLKHTLADLGFQVSNVDPGVFPTRNGDHLTIITVHVDDCTITSSSAELVQDYKWKINKCHSITDLGLIHWLLGIKVTQDRQAHTISLSQESYINTIIDCFELGSANTIPSPIIPGISYSTKDAPADQTEAVCMAKTPYWEAISSLMYAAVATCPDISFAVSTLLQFLENLGEAHWEAVKQVFHYLAGTKGHTLTYGGERQELTGYTDTDGLSQDHQRAISGHTFFINRGVISWSSHKQELITLSTAKAKYVAATHAPKEGIWLCQLISKLFSSIDNPTPLYCDNQAALTLATTDNFHVQTKHIDIHYHFIQHEKSTQELLSLFTA